MGSTRIGLEPGSVIGVDFDNTIISYDALIANVARRCGLVDERVPSNKKAIRDAIRRSSPEGDLAWQRVQAEVYGPAIGEAVPFDGVGRFFQQCRDHGIEVHIVSHKTQFASWDETGTDLRLAAMGRLTSLGAFDPKGFALLEENVWFAETREEKLGRIRLLMCSVFIDDLIEVFLDPAFPEGVRRLLFAPKGQAGMIAGIELFPTWDIIREELFGKDAAIFTNN